jgi:hypothetical protein
MQREKKWDNWPILVTALALVVLALFVARIFQRSHSEIISFYLEDLAGAITAVVLSIATYDEWERRRERKRYYPPEKMGVTRIKQEVLQLLYQYAFVLSLRWEPESHAMKVIKRSAGDKKGFSKPEVELHAKAAKYIFQEDTEVKSDVLKNVRTALEKPKFSKQKYSDINELILQTERAIGQIDMAIAIYGYSFTPEVHKWALQVREKLSQSLTNKIFILTMRLAASSKQADGKLKRSDSKGLEALTSDLLKVEKLANESIEQMEK